MLRTTKGDETQPTTKTERTSFLENFHSKSDVNVKKEGSDFSSKVNRYINPNDSPSKKVMRLLTSRTVINTNAHQNNDLP